uniref:Uncharacterized protein n=1 Tax=Arundo donax TaxID=35708 RepID=A0A0A9BCY9_ARUDO
MTIAKLQETLQCWIVSHLAPFSTCGLHSVVHNIDNLHQDVHQDGLHTFPGK